MSSVVAVRLIPRSCTRVILGTSNLNVFCRKLPLQTLASFSAIQKHSKKLQVPFDFQKSGFSVSSLKRCESGASHDHVKHWTAEKLMAVALLGVIPASVLFPSPAVEYILALSLAVHSHWGIEAIVVDYVRPSMFGKVIPKLTVAAVYAFSALTLGGLFYFIYTDVGIVNAVKLLWKL